MFFLVRVYKFHMYSLLKFPKYICGVRETFFFPILLESNIRPFQDSAMNDEA
jgi:hypothetical protein